MERIRIEKVANGAQLLDERIPNWYTQIDLETLDINNAADCICGQLSGPERNWNSVIDWLAGTTSMANHSGWARFASDHGFTGHCESEWREAIETRRALDALPVTSDDRELAVA